MVGSVFGKFFEEEQKRKRKLFTGEGYPESAAARAKEKADKKDDKKATTPTAAQLATAAGRRSNKRAQRLATGAAKTGTKVKFGVGSDKTVNGKANVTRDQLVKAGFPTNTKGLRDYMNAWNRTGKRPTKAAAEKERKIEDKKPDKRTAAEKVTAQGRRDNARAQRLAAAAKPTTAVARSGNAVPGIRSGDKTPRNKAPIHTAVKRRIKKPTESGNAVPGIRSGDKTPRNKAPIHTAVKRRIKKPTESRSTYDASEDFAKRKNRGDIGTGGPVKPTEFRKSEGRVGTADNDINAARYPRTRAWNARKKSILSQPQRLGKDAGTSEAIDKYLGKTAGGRAGTIASLVAAVGGGVGGAGAVKGLAKKLGRLPTMAEVKAFVKGDITRGEFRSGPKGFKKGGLVKKSAAKKSVAKKSIDGIARKGKTRAKHR